MKPTAKEICALIIKTHRYYGWRAEREALFSPRRIDVLAIKPGGSTVIAYEIKVSRSDFKNELKNPSKRAGVMACSSEFYFVVPKLMVMPSEVPRECGLIYFSDDFFETAKPAPMKDEDSVFELLMAEVRQEQAEIAELRRAENEADWLREAEEERMRDLRDEAQDLDVNLPVNPSRELGWLRNWMFPTRPLLWSRDYLEAFTEMSVGWIDARPTYDFDEVPF